MIPYDPHKMMLSMPHSLYVQMQTLAKAEKKSLAQWLNDLIEREVASNEFRQWLETQTKEQVE